jgi:hypothetical protein
MTALAAESTWEALNGAYLATGLAWLRGRLGPEEDDPGDEPWWDAPACREAALELLGDRLGLTRFERLVLLLAAAIELDPTFAARCAHANGDPAAGHPTFALALGALPDPAWDVVSPHRPLRYWRLLELDTAGAAPLTATRLRVDERILGFLKGLNVLDERLAHVLRPAGETGDALPPSQARAVERIALALTEDPAGDRPPAIELVGVDAAVRRGLAISAARSVGHTLYELAPERLGGAVETMRLWERETQLLPLMLYVDLAEQRDERPDVAALVEEVWGHVLVGCREPWPLHRRAIRVVDAARPTADEQEALWHGVLGDRGESERLAAEFDLNQAVIADVAREVRHAGGGPGELWAACRARVRPRLDTLARRIEPAAGWDDLVLDEAALTLLRHVVDQVRGRATVLRHWGLAERITRGSGVSALFAGASGTGKTLAAEVLAHELELDMYRIDLAGVVSKYIGETERNLRRVFDAAEEGGALLLFDEADALFGKRAEVKDSHDRYANIEVDYLLQRMEDYRGVAILATNQRHALDEAFLRRLRFVVPFPFPGPEQRAQLWRRAFPRRAPVGELDIERLSRLATSGGMIRNIAVNAAFCAAGRGGGVTMDLVLEMARAEFRKLELPIDDADFRAAP